MGEAGERLIEVNRPEGDVEGARRSTALEEENDDAKQTGSDVEDVVGGRGARQRLLFGQDEPIAPVSTSSGANWS